MKKIFLILVVTIQLNAEWESGTDFANNITQWNRMMNDSNSADEFKAFYGMGYVLGIVDSMDGGVFCLPNNAVKGQIWKIVYNYINKNPRKWTRSGKYLVATPLRKAFPCKK